MAIGSGAQRLADLERKVSAQEPGRMSWTTDRSLDDARLNEAEAVAGAGAGGQRVGPDNVAEIHDGDVIPALPGFTVIASGLSDADAARFRVVNPEVVYGTEVWNEPSSDRFAMGDEVWCSVIIDPAEKKIVEVDVGTIPLSLNAESERKGHQLTTVKIASITQDRVVQYHTGAVIVSSGGGDGGAEVGFTGTRIRVTGMTYSTTHHTFVYTSTLDTYQNGLLVSSVVQNDVTVFTATSHADEHST